MKTFLKRNKGWVVWLEGLLLVAFILGFIYIKCGVFFETNDDRLINEMFTGVLTQKPDGHGIFVNYLLGGAIAFLYSIIPEIPWYGGLIILAHLAVYWCVAGILLERSLGIYQHILALCCTAFLVACNIYIFGEIQFTSTAAVLAAGGYFCLLTDEHRIRRHVLFFIFELWAILLRDQSMLMIQLVGGVVWGILLLAGWIRRSRSLKSVCQEGIAVGGILFCCLVLAWGGNHLIGDYSRTAWQEYTHYREIRGDMDDYYGYPSYDKVKDVLEKYDVSEYEYLAFSKYWMLGNTLDIACLEELHEIAEIDYEASRSDPAEIVRAVAGSRFQGGIVGYGKYTLMLYAVTGMLMLLLKRWHLLCALAGLNVSRNIVLAFLIYRGRLPFRVVSGLYFAEILLMTVWLYQLLSEVKKERWMIKLATSTVILAMLVISAESISEVYEALYWKHQGSKMYSQGMDELIEYCRRSDAGYLCVDMATSYYTGEALNTRWYCERNYLSVGGWWGASPHTEAYQREYLEKYRGKLRLIEIGRELEIGPRFAVEMLTHDWGMKLSYLEDVTLSNGLVLSVYEIQGELPLQ